MADQNFDEHAMHTLSEDQADSADETNGADDEMSGADDETSGEDEQFTDDEQLPSEGTDLPPDDGVHTSEQEQEPIPVSGEQDGAAAGEPAGPPKNWYIIHAYSGFEQKVAESLRSRAQAFGFAHRLGQILIPTEEVVELRNGKKVISKRLLYPGYVLIEMEMDDELWHAVKSTQRVTGFVGGGTKPIPLTADEVNSVLYRQAASADRPRPKMTFEKNETVKIIDGPFTNFSGKVDEVNTERNTLRVMVTIFGRSTPVELDFLQVEKI